jgi:ketosteroid isomerase-like protein
MRLDRFMLVVGVAAVACARPSGGRDTSDELMAADRAFARATAERGADGWAETFAEDARMYQRAGYVEGRAAIREAMVPAFANPRFTLRWEPVSAVAAASGDLGYTLGRWESVLKTLAGTDSVTARGNYVTIWRRQPDGSWKVSADIGNSDPAE